MKNLEALFFGSVLGFMLWNLQDALDMPRLGTIVATFIFIMWFRENE